MRHLFKALFGASHHVNNASHHPKLTEFLEHNLFFRRNVLKIHRKRKSFFKNIDEYLEKEKSQMTNENVFNINYTLSQGITEEMKVEMIKAVQKSSVAFVE